MMKAERQEQILKKIEANGRVVVTDYAKELGVTEATLRKDLQELDDRGLVQRVHGGAMKPDTELSRFEKSRRPRQRRQNEIGSGRNG